MILIVGATGSLGTEITRQLAKKGQSIRAMVRPTSDQAKVDILRGLGAEIVWGEMQDPASLDAACQGTTAVISTVSAMPSSYQPQENNIQNVDVQGLTHLIDAASAQASDTSSTPRFQVESISTSRSAMPNVRSRSRSRRVASPIQSCARPTLWRHGLARPSALTMSVPRHRFAERAPIRSVGSRFQMWRRLPWQVWTTRQRKTLCWSWVDPKRSVPWMPSRCLRMLGANSLS